MAGIISVAEAICGFTAGRSRQDYGADLLLRSAVERQLEIRGEAIRRLERLDATLAAGISDYRRIIGLRNIIAHGYASVDEDIVWQAIQIKVPIVLTQARALLARLASPP